jgi:peptidoglycan/LPS O-acetylase OafA/YrhL
MGLFRFLLAFVVLLHHLPDAPNYSLLLGGPEAVETFYMISGFYMAMVLDKKYSHCLKTYKTFIVSRFLRIYPQYLVVAILTLASYYVVTSLLSAPYDRFILAYYDKLNSLDLWEGVMLIFTSIAIFGQDWLAYLFDGKYHMHHPVSIGWSLACELTFYLTAPIIFHFSKRRLAILLAFFLLLRFALLPVLGIKFVYFLPVTQFPLFLIGFLVYRLGDFKVPKALLVLSIIICIAYMLFGAMGVRSTMHLKLRIVSDEVVSVGRVGNFAYWLFYPSVALLLWKIHKLDFGRFANIERFIGNLSYPVYLSHRLVINYFSLFLVSSLFARIDIFFYVAIFIATVAISVFLEVFIQRRVDRFRGRFVKKALRVSPG